MMQGFTNALRGISGEYELSRLVGFFGGIAYTLCTNAFVAYEVIWQGKDFDVTAYCLAFSGGLAAITTGTAAAVSIKDRNVASAKVIEQTGAVPAPPLDGPRVPTGKPPPVQDAVPPAVEAAVDLKADEPVEQIPDYAR